MAFNPKWLVGKTIARVAMNPFKDGKGGTAYGPYLYFTDGSSLAFSTQETEVGEYGTDLWYRPAKPRPSTAKPAPAPTIRRIDPAIEAKLFEQMPTSMRTRLVGAEYATTRLHDLPPDLLHHAREYMTGKRGPDR